MNTPIPYAEDQAAISRFGFDDLPRGVHTGRTMMLAELETVMESLAAPRSRANVRRAIVEENLCGKPTYSSRVETASRILRLYSFDQNAKLYAAFESLWELSRQSRPVLALLLACCRDPVLRSTAETLSKTPLGEMVAKESLYDELAQRFPKFAETTLQSVSRNVMASWKQSGHLKGKRVAVRAKAPSDYVAATYAVVIALVRGMRGHEVLDSVWVRLLDQTQAELEAVLQEAARHGLLTYRRVGQVIELTEGLFFQVEARREGVGA